MAGNVIRLVSGGTIQVRTGVLQGIGPQGPTGQVGPEGPPGPQGPTGEVGPMGQILQVQGRTSVTTTSVGADTDTLVNFGSVVYDDLSCFTSATNITLSEIGDYMISCYVRFDLPSNAGDGARHLWFTSTTGGLIARKTVNAVADDVTWVDLSYPWRTTVGNEVINVRVRSGDDLSVGVTEGALTITRIGSGPQGIQGPAGPAGPVGPAGPAGPAGADGSASSGFATYGDLLP